MQNPKIQQKANVPKFDFPKTLMLARSYYKVGSQYIQYEVHWEPKKDIFIIKLDNKIVNDTIKTIEDAHKTLSECLKSGCTSDLIKSNIVTYENFSTYYHKKLKRWYVFLDSESTEIGIVRSVISEDGVTMEFISSLDKKKYQTLAECVDAVINKYKGNLATDSLNKKNKVRV